jgi:hypothetical protein
MSKMDNLRAMREARYAKSQERGAAQSAGGAAQRPASKPAGTTPKAASRQEQTESPAEAEEELCGHRNMSGRTCTRERGHAAKSHRYS